MVARTMAILDEELGCGCLVVSFLMGISGLILGCIGLFNRDLHWPPEMAFGTLGMGAFFFLIFVLMIVYVKKKSK